MTNKNLNERGQQLSKSLMNTGQILKSKQANAALQKYFEISGTDPDDPEHVYGFVYGLTAVRDLLAKIDKANENATDPEKQIVGLRFLKAYSKRENLDFKLNADVFYEDLLVTPVYATGANYLKGEEGTPPTGGDGEGGDSGDDDDLSLGGSRPCPNQCG